MVELGDLREGIMPGELESSVRQILRFPHILINVSLKTQTKSADSALPRICQLPSGSPVESRQTEFSGGTVGGDDGRVEWAVSSRNRRNPAMPEADATPRIAERGTDDGMKTIIDEVASP